MERCASRPSPCRWLTHLPAARRQQPEQRCAAGPTEVGHGSFVLGLEVAAGLWKFSSSSKTMGAFSGGRLGVTQRADGQNAAEPSTTKHAATDSTARDNEAGFPGLMASLLLAAEP
jgi:hypothetical protein